jgi:predicted permease
MIAGIIVRLKAVVFRRRADDELDEEMRYHLERDVERNIANGMTPADARFAARRAFGNVAVMTDDARDAMRWRWLEEAGQDIRFTLRTIRRAPGFALVVVATIGLGLGLLAAAFTAFNAYVLRPLAVRDADRLYDVLAYTDDGIRPFSWQRVRELRARRDLADDAYAYSFFASRIRGGAALGQLVSENYFEMLGVPPALGRTFVADDGTPPHGADVIVLSHRVWQTAFGGDSSVIGQRITMSGVSLAVIGVAREGFGGLTSAPIDFWAPLTVSGRFGNGDPFAIHPSKNLAIVIRAPLGTSMEHTAKALGEWFRETTREEAAVDRIGTVHLVPRGTALPATQEVYQLFAPIGVAFLLILLIACANVANMMLARGVARQREIGIRLAIGAGRRRLLRQLLTESVVLSVPAALLAILISRVLIDVVVRVVFATVPAEFAESLRVIPFGTDARFVAFMLVAAVGSAVAFGLAPALQATRPDIVRASRGDFDAGQRPSGLRHGLVAAQVALSVVLLISAGLLLRNATRTNRIDPGVQTHDVLQLAVPDRSRAAVIDDLRADPTVEAIASASSAPLDHGWWVIGIRNAAGLMEATNVNFVSAEYFDVLGLAVSSGRTFTTDEANGRTPVVIVSEAAAKRFWPDADPIGQTLSLTPPRIDTTTFGPFRRATVIGVVRNAVPGTIARPVTWPAVYYPQPLDARGGRLLANVRGDASGARSTILARLAEADSSAINDAHSLASAWAVQTYPFRIAHWLAIALGSVALLLTITGVYGVVSYLVSQRRKELGIRLALGAPIESVISLVLRESMRAWFVGSAIGIAGALGLSAVIAGSVFVSSAFDIVGYVSGVAAVGLACLGAAYVPTRRAAAIDPVSALRADS